MPNIALVKNGVVVNVVFVDDQTPETWLEDQKSAQALDAYIDLTELDPMPGMGWSYDGSEFTAPLPEPLLPTLIADPVIVPSDGTKSKVTYTVNDTDSTTDEVTFVVNDSPITKPLVDREASIHVSGKAAMTVQVECEGLVATVEISSQSLVTVT